MLMFVDFTVKLLCSVLLSACAMIALVFAPPVGIAMLLLLRRYLRHEVGGQQRPQLQIKLS